VRLVATIGFAIGGLVLCFASAIRLGWMRHGASPFDLGFLHVGWALNPSQPFWRGHIENLAGLAVGIAMIAGSVVLLVRQRARRRLAR